MVLHQKIKVRIDYTAYGKIENFLLNGGYLVDETIFDDGVNIFVYIEDQEVEKFQNLITDMTNGNNEFEILGEEYIAIKDGERVN